MMKMLGILLSIALILVLFTACADTTVDRSDTERPEQSSEISAETSDSPEVVTTPPTIESDVPTKETEESTDSQEPETAVTNKPDSPAISDIEAVDANLYNTKDNAVPLGQWVYYQAKNFTSDEYEPYYVRIIRISRDQAEIQAAIDNYSGYRDFSLTEEQARDIEYRLIEYEIYFSPDYAASDYGISIPTLNWNATPIETAGFRTDGGMSYIGVGGTDSLNINGSSYHPQPGDTVKEKGLFSVLKNYDESEYVFHIGWYDGEIVTEKARDLYLAVA